MVLLCPHGNASGQRLYDQIDFVYTWYQEFFNYRPVLRMRIYYLARCRQYLQEIQNYFFNPPETGFTGKAGFLGVPYAAINIGLPRAIDIVSKVTQ
jgi:hypothetical protein